MSQKLKAIEAQDGPMHFHLCHSCNHLNESAYLILRCEKCKSPMTLMAMADEEDGEHSVWEEDGHEEEAADSSEENPRVVHEDDYPLLTGLSTLF